MAPPVETYGLWRSQRAMVAGLPEPVRKMRPNEPKNVAHIIRELARLRGESVEDFDRAVTDYEIRRGFERA